MANRTRTARHDLRLVEDRWQDLWQGFELELKSAKASPRTISIYRDGGDLFHSWCVERQLPTHPRNIDKQQVQRFLVWLREEYINPKNKRQGAAEATVRARFSCLRRFFNWCVADGTIERSPMEGMHGPKVEITPPDVLTDEEAEALLIACKGNDFFDKRDMALLHLMMETGLRRSEAANIMVEDVDFDRMQVRIFRGKGGKPGVAFLNDETARDLHKYVRIRDSHYAADKTVERAGEQVHPLWLAQKGGLSSDGVHHIWKRRARLAGIERRTFPHLARHSFGHRAKAAGLSDEDVMTLGRWSDHKSMLRYGASARQERAREAYKRMSQR